MRLPRLFVALFVAATFAACQTSPSRTEPESSQPANSSDRLALLIGDFDSYRQSLAGSARWQITASRLPRSGWLLWSSSADAGSGLSLILALRLQAEADGRVALTPHWRSGTPQAPLQAFDPAGWQALEACTLRGRLTNSAGQLDVDRGQCASVAPALLGESTALLPVSIVASIQGLRLRSYADTSTDVASVIDARRVRWFSGWAAILGGGSQARADSDDWHMNRRVRLGSEGGRAALTWRDGMPAGYFLTLENATARNGEMPLLKLSIVDAGNQVIAYAWAAPDTDRLGINLGWIQVGLDARSEISK